ncbi:MAG: DUF5606 domain-containing protein [Saprospiraceae bacterium]|nr:DUF5606 domain-containing protein [Saprospiraceae bacterium]MBK6564560.1 DUF5606 domain-containing protein [Saprospiraceae bacterium]MBK6782750.1 DUF5606 domain-containing protein [Saprospiraceae bacterium]MBK7523196.1 DUF5606 domain-containing protein [Saprospiraceae bacterium]MBK8371809.1 DUF5606 domain-containing protein [Saprospiraceae bacterium]
MTIDKMVAVSGLAGLFKLVSTKSNGLLVADPDTGKTRFCSVRQHQFTPMQTVAIYTDTDTIDIKSVFKTMSSLSESHPVPNPNAPQQELRKYFEIIIPDYDRDRVYHSDMKKVLKWFIFLNDRGLIKELFEEVTESPEDEKNQEG